MEATNKDVERFYKKPYTNPPKFNVGRPKGSKKKTKAEESFRETYGFYSRSDREMDEFLKWKSGEKGFCIKKK